jgi:hypothetical protein
MDSEEILDDMAEREILVSVRRSTCLPLALPGRVGGRRPSREQASLPLTPGEGASRPTAHLRRSADLLLASIPARAAPCRSPVGGVPAAFCRRSRRRGTPRGLQLVRQQFLRRSGKRLPAGVGPG